MRGDSVDLVLSAYALGFVEDLNRVFRQVHRVLKDGSPFVVSLPHPATTSSTTTARPWSSAGRISTTPRWPTATTTPCPTCSPASAGPSSGSTSCWQPEPSVEGNRSPFWDEAARWVPRTLVIRARKEGI